MVGQQSGGSAVHDSRLEYNLRTTSARMAALPKSGADDFRMSDNPKSLASLADDLEALAKRIQTGLPNAAADLCFRAAAALRAPTIAADARPPSSEGVEAIAAERRRQVTVEGWSPEHDDAHDEGDLLAAAICYAEDAFWGPRGDPKPRDGWPWDAKWWKPKGKLRNLARAGALIAAEFDRTVRQARHGASDRLEAAALATPSPTIAAPSPSNEPAVEWVMCAVRDAMREHNFVVERGSDLWNHLRRHIEAALKARKPADDGAGQ